MDELKPPPMSDEQIGAIYNPWTDCAGASFADLMTATAAARDQQWLALVGELQRDAALWRQLAYMEASRVAPETLAHYIARPDRLDFAAKIVAEQTLDAVRNVQSPAIVDGIQSDAARYRWLRSKTRGERGIGRPAKQWFGFPGHFELPPQADIMRGSVAQHLDAAIDAAIDAARGEKGGV